MKLKKVKKGEVMPKSNRALPDEFKGLKIGEAVIIDLDTGENLENLRSKFSVRLRRTFPNEKYTTKKITASRIAFIRIN